MTMHIQIRQLCDETVLGDVLQYLWGAKTNHPSRRIYATGDSVLQLPLWIAFCEAPRSVYAQIATHRKKDFFYPWSVSARPDRDMELAKSYSREQPIRFVFVFSSKSAIEISHQRLCMKAETPTREFVSLWKTTLSALGDTASVETAKQMMPMCAYRNGLCTELHGCGNPQKYPWLANK